MTDFINHLRICYGMLWYAVRCINARCIGGIDWLLCNDGIHVHPVMQLADRCVSHDAGVSLNNCATRLYKVGDYLMVIIVRYVHYSNS